MANFSILNLLLLFHIICNVMTSAQSQLPQFQLYQPPSRDIRFPTVDLSNDCFVDEQRNLKGTCKTLAECPSALERWTNENLRPQTCYFNKFEHIVCCELPTSTPIFIPTENPRASIVQRKSEMECESYYVFRTSIVHGIPTAPREFPHMVALGWKANFDNSIIYRCGGVLVSANFVLTAAHCTESGGELPVVVRIGGANLTDPTVSEVNIKRIIVHPKYNPTSTYNDIALIELATQVSERPACIWSTDVVDHNNVTAIGYGQTQFAGTSSEQLLKAPLFLVSNDVCRQYYKPTLQQLPQGIIDSQICAGDPEHLRDTCQGDSGGPLIIKVERDTLMTYVVGITSFGQGCAGEPPSIYTRTSAYIDWIENIVWPK